MSPTTLISALCCTSPAPLVGLVLGVAGYYALAAADWLAGGAANDPRRRARERREAATQEISRDADDRDEYPRCPRNLAHPAHGRIPARHQRPGAAGHAGRDPHGDPRRPDLAAADAVARPAVGEAAGDRGGAGPAGTAETWVARRGGHVLYDDHGSERLDIMTTQADGIIPMEET